jgi:hypothetical protein
MSHPLCMPALLCWILAACPTFVAASAVNVTKRGAARHERQGQGISRLDPVKAEVHIASSCVYIVHLDHVRSRGPVYGGHPEIGTTNISFGVPHVG